MRVVRVPIRSSSGIEVVLMSHVFALIIELAIAAGCPKPLHSHRGAWGFTFTRDGTTWRVFVNGHDTPQRVSAMDIEPFGYAIFCGDFPAALGGPHDGGCMGGTEQELIEILTAAKEQFPAAEARA